MRVLVSGSSGQVGSYLVDALREAGMSTLGVDLRPSRWTDLVQDIRQVSSAEGCDAVVHCAAQVSVPRSVEDPREDARQNVDGTLALLDLARRADVSRFVYISSAAVYGDAPVLPLREDFPAQPLTPYGLSKWTGEAYAMLHHRLYSLRAVSLRPMNIFSPRQDPSNPYSGVISKFAASLRAGQPGTLFGAGSQTRDFVHARDVVQAIRLALVHPEAVGQVMNVGTGHETSILELHRIMARAAGVVTPPVLAPSRVGDIERSVANISRLVKLGYRPTTDLATDLREMLS